MVTTLLYIEGFQRKGRKKWTKQSRESSCTNITYTLLAIVNCIKEPPLSVEDVCQNRVNTVRDPYFSGRNDEGKKHRQIQIEKQFKQVEGVKGKKKPIYRHVLQVTKRKYADREVKKAGQPWLDVKKRMRTRNWGVYIYALPLHRFFFNAIISSFSRYTAFFLFSLFFSAAFYALLEFSRQSHTTKG